MQKKTKAGLACDVTPDMHRLYSGRDTQPGPDRGSEIPPIAPSQPHEWKELRLDGGTFGREAL